MDKWLNACISMERAFTTIKGTQFNKKKSRQMAKRFMLLVSVVSVCTVQTAQQFTILSIDDCCMIMMKPKINSESGVSFLILNDLKHSIVSSPCATFLHHFF